MRRLRVLAQLIRADLLERTRRYSFLITLGVMVYLGYLTVPSIESRALTVDLGNIRGIYNSAWIGSMIALISSMVLALPGFYLVKNAIEGDRRTSVGQIIATTPLSKPLYTLGTNSFSIPLPEPMPPSFQVLGRSGPYEIASYILAATATYGVSANRFRRLIPPDSEPVEPTPEFAKNVDWIGLVLGVALLIAANAYEAYMIVSLA